MRGKKVVHKPAISRQTVAYARVSTIEQSTEGVSLPAQEERLRAFAVATGRVLGEVIADEGASAKDLNRSGLQRILAQVRDGSVSFILVLKLDRLTRSVRDLLYLIELFEKHDVALISINEHLDTSSPMGRCVIKVIGSFSELEREQIAERTAFALTHLRRSGRAYGPTAFGWRREGDRLVADPAQQSALAMARKMFASGASLRQIATALTRQGIRTMSGRDHWQASSVRSILRSKLSAEAG